MPLYSLTVRFSYLLTTLFTGIIAGLFFAFAYDVNIAFEQLNASEYAKNMELINVSIRNSYFFFVWLSGIVLPVIALVLSWRSYRSPSFQLFLVGFLIYAIGCFLITMQIHIPLNQYLESWNIASPPAEWIETRASWNSWHMVRTWAAIIAFVFYLIVLMLPMPQQRALKEA